MRLQINGEQRDFPDGLTVASLVEHLGMKVDRVAVELNLEIVPRVNWAATNLKDSDKLEIVHFVGGGRGADLSEVQHEKAQEMERDEQANVLRPASADWTCANCGTSAQGRFCSACGEKKPEREDLSVRHMLSHAGETLFHWDSKIFRTFRILLTKPGALSVAYVEGRRKSYVHPFQTFFIANVLYFLAHPFIGWSGLKTPLRGYENMFGYSAWATRMATQRAALKGLSATQFAASFNHLVDIQSRSLLLIMVPIFTCFLVLFSLRKRRLLGEHLVFALHFYAAYLLVASIVVASCGSLVLRFARHYGLGLSDARVDGWMTLVTGFLVFGYLFIAQRVFYQDTRLAAAAKALLFVFIVFETMQLYRIILFVTALYSV